MAGECGPGRCEGVLEARHHVIDIISGIDQCCDAGAMSNNAKWVLIDRSGAAAIEFNAREAVVLMASI